MRLRNGQVRILIESSDWDRAVEIRWIHFETNGSELSAVLRRQ